MLNDSLTQQDVTTLSKIFSQHNTGKSQFFIREQCRHGSEVKGTYSRVSKNYEYLKRQCLNAISQHESGKFIRSGRDDLEEGSDDFLLCC